jgi:NTP pyrophosphatase (non-canonical NTP hydrolase)
MKLNDYQNKALKTAIYRIDDSIIYPALGLVNEAGEVAGKIKKTLRDFNGHFNANEKRKIAEEAGDVLWYLAALANDIGYTLEEIAEINVTKLESRQKRGKLQGSGDNR